MDGQPPLQAPLPAFFQTGTSVGAILLFNLTIFVFTSFTVFAIYAQLFETKISIGTYFF